MTEAVERSAPNAPGRAPLVTAYVMFALGLLVPLGSWAGRAADIIPYTDNLLISIGSLTCWGQFLISGLAFLLHAGDNRRGGGLGWRHHVWAVPAALVSVPVSAVITLQFFAVFNSGA